MRFWFINIEKYQFTTGLEYFGDLTDYLTLTICMADGLYPKDDIEGLTLESRQIIIIPLNKCHITWHLVIQEITIGEIQCRKLMLGEQLGKQSCVSQPTCANLQNTHR